MRSARRRPRLVERLRADFLTGLAVVLPAGLTAVLVVWAIGILDARVAPLLPGRPAYEQVVGFGIVVFLILTTLAGAFARGLMGRRLVAAAERLVAMLPVVRSIHLTMKQMVETAIEKAGTSLGQVCLVEYPERGNWVIAFLVTDAEGELPARTGTGDLAAIFVPTTPNPITGFLAYAPRSDLKLLDLTPEEGAKLVMTAGLVAEGPAEPRPVAPTGRKPV